MFEIDVLIPFIGGFVAGVIFAFIAMGIIVASSNGRRDDL